MMQNTTIEERFSINKLTGFDTLLLCVWTLPVIMFNLRGLVYRFLGEFCADCFLPLVFTICIIKSFKYIVHRTKIIDFIFFLSFVVYYFFCSSYYIESALALDEIFEVFLFHTLPVFFIGVCIDINKSFKLLKILSIICLIIKALSVFLFGYTDRISTSEEMESMSTAHNILPYALFLLWSAFKDGGIKNWVIAAFSVAFILSLGNRGALFGILLFFALYFVFFKEFKHPIRSRLIIIILSLLVYYLLVPIMVILMSIFSSLGMSTRIFAKFLADNIQDDNGREVIIENTMYEVVHGPFWGYGLTGDRLANGGLWTHNLFVEFLATFGYYPGIVISLLFITMIIWSFIKCGKSDRSAFMLILFCTCSILLFSSSFVQYPFFFFLIGYCFQMLRYKNIHVITNK